MIQICTRPIGALALGTLLAVLLAPPAAHAQLFQFSKQDLLDYTAQSPFDRLPDGRPKVPDELIERAREMSAEEVWAVLPGKGFNNQYADGFQVLHPGKQDPNTTPGPIGNGAWFRIDPEGLETPFWPRFPWTALHRFPEG